MQTLHRPQESVTVVVAGELDHFTAPAIRAQLDDILRDPGILHRSLDMADLTFMDSSGIGVLLGRLRLLQARGGTMGVRHMRPAIEKLFRLSGMQRVMMIEDEGGRQ
ncbi:MAG: STAS domain-containing protein [Eubacteriales bacterium]|nr:STAS domain-containing protein [Eubacteriales bacterium]